MSEYCLYNHMNKELVFGVCLKDEVVSKKFKMRNEGTFDVEFQCVFYVPKDVHLRAQMLSHQGNMLKSNVPLSMVEMVDLETDESSIQGAKAYENTNSLNDLRISNLANGELEPYRHPDLTISPRKGLLKPGEEVNLSLHVGLSDSNSKLHAALKIQATGKVFKGDIFAISGTPTIELQSVQKVRYIILHIHVLLTLHVFVAHV
jgi:hypothetical protein